MQDQVFAFVVMKYAAVTVLAVLMNENEAKERWSSDNTAAEWRARRWDVECKLQRKSTPCGARERRWYYELAADACWRFDYGGCRGRPNRFRTREECEARYRGNVQVRLRAALRDDVTCSLQPDAGPCVASADSWYYDVDKRACRVFSYGGCGGNGNRFETRWACAERCGGGGSERAPSNASRGQLERRSAAPGASVRPAPSVGAALKSIGVVGDRHGLAERRAHTAVAERRAHTAASEGTVNTDSAPFAAETTTSYAETSTSPTGSLLSEDAVSIPNPPQLNTATDAEEDASVLPYELSTSSGENH